MVKTPFYRIYQFILRIAAYFTNIHEPKVCKDVDLSNYIYDVLKQKGLSHPLIVTGKSLFSYGTHNSLVKEFENKKMIYSIYAEVTTNPTISNVNNGLKIYKEESCDSIIALGGGSIMDCAKVIGALATNKNKTVEKLKGLLHVRKRMPFFVAIPTTAGTGSETTIAAVIVNEETHHKYAISDPHLIPDLVILDARYLVNLPSKITSTTGMDALTHAVEAYIGRSNTSKTKRCALKAVKLIYENLYNSYIDPHNFEYRIKMQEAAYLAGVAFTRAYVGYVHAVAHSMGGKYNVPHGYANAIIMPYVLESYGKKAYKKLARLSDEISLCEKDEKNEVKAKAFISWIREMNAKMDIPEKFDIVYEKKDVEEMAKNAIKEGNPLYPVPREFNLDDFKDIYRKILM